MLLGRIELALMFDNQTWDTIVVTIDWDDPIWTPVEMTEDMELLAWRIAQRYQEAVAGGEVVLVAPYHFGYDELAMDEETFNERYGEDDESRLNNVWESITGGYSEMVDEDEVFYEEDFWDEEEDLWGVDDDENWDYNDEGGPEN
jgi:hypothetical protein